MIDLFIGQSRPIAGKQAPTPLRLPAHHLTTHGVVVGMTGSGKTGLVTVLVEEAIRAGIPTLVIDVKGDLPNLLLAFPSFNASFVRPWAAATMAPNDTRSLDEVARAIAAERQEALSRWGIDEAALRAFAATTRVLRPAAEPLLTVRIPAQ